VMSLKFFVDLILPTALRPREFDSAS